jgi:esterase/lipase superfamily enzyme
MFKPFDAVCLAFAMWAAMGGAAFGQNVQQVRGRQVSVKITGKLTDAQGVPISGATVGVARWDAGVWQPLPGKTSDAGDYSFSIRLQPGSYMLIAAIGKYRITDALFDVGRTEEPPRKFDLRASLFEGRHDGPPAETPRVGVLPQGSILPPPAPPPPPPPPAPSPPQPGSQEFVTVYYATNRTEVAGQQGQFVDQPNIQPTMSYGDCTVSIPPTHQPGQMNRPSIWRIRQVEDVNQHIVITGREVLPGEAMFQQKLHQAFQEGGSEAFIFVHGYNVDFDDAVRRTAQLFRDLQFNGVPILFSWPGQDGWWRYSTAESIIDDSSRKLEAFIRQTLANERLTAVNVVAHSMGNRVLAGALERLSLRSDASRGDNDRRFNNIVMAAPDINVADFDAVSSVLKASARHTTIYSSSHDVALELSKLFHSYPRLGEAPPLRVSSDIETVDASAVRADILGHSYFGSSATMLRDISLLIRDGLSPAARHLMTRTLGQAHYWAIPPP